MFLVSSGVDVWRIQIYGRWGSDTVSKYVRLTPLIQSLALEVSLGKVLTDVRAAILDAKATLANMTTTSNNVMEEEALVAALGFQLGASASFLGIPRLDHILGNTAVKGWHRDLQLQEILVSNVSPPEYSGKLHALRPPRLHPGPPPTWDKWDTSDFKAWCGGLDFVAAKDRVEFVIWDGTDKMKATPRCNRCFGKRESKVTHSSSTSSYLSS